MCGRYRLTKAELCAEINDIREMPRYNIAPTQKVTVATRDPFGSDPEDDRPHW